MTTVDSVLSHLASCIKTIENQILKKDKRILVSLAKQLQSNIFLTENQGKLLVKILKEYLSVIKTVVPNVEEVVEAEEWSKEFRIVEKVRKIHLDEKDPLHFYLEFSYNSRLKEKFQKIIPELDRPYQQNGARWTFLLTEKNIFFVVSAIINDDFEIDENIMNFYREIEKVKKTDNRPFDIFSTTHEKLKKSVIADIISITPENLLRLQDRKIRYQYEITEKSTENSLAGKISNREARTIYLNPNNFTFTEVVASLVELDRKSLMIVFDGHEPEKDKKTLNLLKNAVDELDLSKEIGIYYRYDKALDTVNFNSTIAELGYNKDLGDATSIAGISNTRLPKFMIKSGWKPETVITFTNSFRNNKASVYCTDVDLVIYYNLTKPINEAIHELM